MVADSIQTGLKDKYLASVTDTAFRDDMTKISVRELVRENPILLTSHSQMEKKSNNLFRLTAVLFG